MTILENIVLRKRAEVDARKQINAIGLLETMDAYKRNIVSLKADLIENKSSGIIAEFKRKSPSKGWINEKADPVMVTTAYQSYGASAVSILTDEFYFGGSDKDIINCRPHLTVPILRKEFIVDPYQIHESKSLGADLILLIAACLTPKEVLGLAKLAHDIGLEVLLELHDEEELDHVCDAVDFVGINNRSLKTFDVNIERSIKMAAKLPPSKLKIAESGISDPSQVRTFKENGYSGFLIGESFMKDDNPGEAFRNFTTKI
jgi:indole-3-glycerol phosphate synthase